MSKHTYAIEVQCERGTWSVLLLGEQLGYARGYLQGRADSGGLRLAMRLIRSDGHVLEQRDAVTRLPIGQVAGMPTPEQYERAAAEALEQARVARESTRFIRC